MLTIIYCVQHGIVFGGVSYSVVHEIFIPYFVTYLSSFQIYSMILLGSLGNLDRH